MEYPNKTATMKIKILKRKLVKPCIPTPPNLKNYKLSFLDEILPLMEIGVLLFYPSNPKPIHLEQSLAKVLPSFYPLAGRFIIKDQIVDCSDQGAEFIEAEAPHAELAALLLERDHENLHAFLPRKNEQVDDVATYPILSIQTTQLKCGGLVIGVTVSHKIFDVSAVSTFLVNWSNAVNPNPETAAATPTFDGAALFPRRVNQSSSSSSATFRFLDMDRISVKRFSFNKEAIAGLRMSKVRAVCAVIAKALMRLDRAKHGRSRDCVITQAVNMRERTTPPLSRHACGNLVLLSVARCSAPGEGVADVLGDAARKAVSDCAGILALDEDRRNAMLMEPLRSAGRAFMSGEEIVLSFTDYSKFGWYGVDLGWGKPEWASIAPHASANTVVVMGSRDGDGIEAWVHLEKNDMPLFEQDHQIAKFCALG